MPTKRFALVTCLALLAACSPRAADTGSPPAVADAVDAGADVVASTSPPTPAGQDDAAVEAASPTPSLEQLQRARAQAGCAVPADLDDLGDIGGYCTLPEDVRTLLVREANCQHFLGEEPYDPARRQALDTAIDDLCSGREQRFSDLYERHYDDCVIRHFLIGVGRRYDLFTDADAQDYCRPQDVR